MKVVLEIQTKILKLSKITTITMVKTPGESDDQLRSYGQNMAFWCPF